MITYIKDKYIKHSIVKTIYIRLNDSFRLNIPSTFLFKSNYIITSIKVKNDIENIEYSIKYSDKFILLQNKVEKDKNLYFDEILPINIDINFNLYLILYSIKKSIIKLEIEAIELDDNYYKLLEHGSHIFIDEKNEIILKIKDKKVKLELMHNNSNYKIISNNNYKNIKISNIEQINGYKNLELDQFIVAMVRSNSNIISGYCNMDYINKRNIIVIEDKEYYKIFINIPKMFELIESFKINLDLLDINIICNNRIYNNVQKYKNKIKLLDNYINNIHPYYKWLLELKFSKDKDIEFIYNCIDKLEIEYKVSVADNNIRKILIQCDYIVSLDTISLLQTGTI